MGLGPWEIAFILLLLAIIFGVGRLSQIGGAMGKSVKDFRTAVHEEPVAAAPVVSVPPIICAACQTSNVGTNKFCSGCGATLASQVAAPVAPEPGPLPAEPRPASVEAQPATAEPQPATAQTEAPPAEAIPSAASEPSVLEGGHPPPATASASTNTCPSCATVNPPGQPFCGQCGTRLTTAAA